MGKRVVLCAVIAFSLAQCFAQSSSDYTSSGSDSSKGGLIDMKRLSVHNSISYGMSSFGGGSPLQSQGLYTTMLTYRFSQPVTLNLNFGFPLMSTFSQAQNLNAENIQSLAYFKSMPINMALTWQPRPNLLFNLSIMRNCGYGYDNGYGYGYGMIRDPFMPIYFPETNRGVAASNGTTAK
jgi:hypothetical protein